MTVLVGRASVLINNFNYGRYLSQAIESALDQDWPDLEVVVVDDGSTDGSRAVIETFTGRVVTVLQENAGQASALNAGFRASTGEVVLLLDADDYFLPGKVETVMRVLSRQPTLGWCFHPLQYDGGEDENPPGAVGPVDARTAMRRGRPHGVMAPATTGLSFSRSLLEQILPMPERFRVPLPGGGRGTAADAFVKAASLALAPGLVVADSLAVQRLHDANAYTGTHGSDPQRAMLEMLIAAELRRRWPFLRRYALRRGMGGLRRLGGVEATDRTVASAVDEFIAGCTVAERLRIRAHCLRWRLVGCPA